MLPTASQQKKSKRDTSALPACDIQDIINQVLAKNKTSQPGSSAPEMSQTSLAKPSILGKTLSKLPETEIPVAAVPSSTVTGSSPIMAPSKETRDSRVAKKSKAAPCPVCAQPFHLRYTCPIVLGGPESIQNRIKELKAARPILKPLIGELQILMKKAIAKKTRRRDPLSMDGTSEGVLETAQEDPLGADDTPSVPSTTVVGNDSDGDTSDEYDRDLPEPLPVTDSDDHLDALLRGPKQPDLHKSVLLEISSENSAEDEEEREDQELEVEDDEGEAKKVHHMTKRYEYDGSSDEDEVVNNGQESLSPTPPFEAQPNSQASYSSAFSEEGL